MKFLLRTVVLIAATLSLITEPLLSGTTGKISGRVIDAVTGEGLPGVNVIIQGTTQGTTTDIDGYYDIIKVKPGTYTVEASFVGYASVIVQEVVVIVDKTTKVDFSLDEAMVEGQEVVVTAERPIVQMDRTTTTAVVTGEQLESLPVTDVVGAVNLQAGIVDGHFRGGRDGEVSYLVNGMPINNPYTNERAFEIENNQVSSLEVISGVFNAEYGQALSGVVNIVTKENPSKWTGSFLGYLGANASSRDLEFMNRTAPPGVGLSASDFVTDTVSYSQASDFPNLTDIQLSLGGPIIGSKLGINTTFRYLDDNGWRIGRDLFSPGDQSFGLNSGAPREAWFISSTGSGEFFPLDTRSRMSVNATLGYDFSPGLRLDYNIFFQDDENRRYLHDMKYVPTGINTTQKTAQNHIVGLTYTVGENAFGNISYSFLKDDTDFQLYDDPTDERYARQEQSSLQGANAFWVAGNELFTENRHLKTHTFLADYTWQMDKVHELKFGVLGRLHDIDNHSFGIERSFRTNNLPQPSPDAFSNNTLETNPKEFAAYAQDKMEFVGLIVNAGLRFDYFDPDFDVPVDWSQAALEEIRDPQNPDLLISNRTPAPRRTQVSPRLGIAFPISAAGVMRFSAGMFFQTPRLELLYTNPEYEVNPQLSSSGTQFGNAALEPERTLSFEVGLQQGLTDQLGLELTVFSKDVRNLTGQEIERTPNGDRLFRWVNFDYGTIRGVTFSMFQRPGGKLSWTIDYTLQFAEGTASQPGEEFDRQINGLEPIRSLVRLNWDRRHVLNNTITWSVLKGLDLTFVNILQSGTPYTTVRNFIRSIEKNNEDKPTTFTTDLRAFYSPGFIKPDVQLFFQIQNLFDETIEWNVYEDTGSATESVTKELFRSTGTAVGGLNSLDEYFFDQNFFGPPRRVSVGLSYRF